MENNKKIIKKKYWKSAAYLILKDLIFFLLKLNQLSILKL
jgi:hypothetical protein